MMRITKKLLAIVLSVCVLASLCACKDEKTKNENNNETQTSQTETQNVSDNTNSNANASQNETDQEENTEESKKIEYTQITEKEFSELVEQANSDDEQVKKEALAKLQVILDEVEQNSPKN